MKILFVTPRFPFPPDRGDRLRCYHFAKTLAAKHNVHLLSFIENNNEKKQIDELKSIFSRIDTVLLSKSRSYLNMLLGVFARAPLQVHYYKSKTMKAMIHNLIEQEKYDVVYTFHLRMAQYTRDNQKAYNVLDLTDAVSLFIKRMIKYRNIFWKVILFKEYLSLLWYESRLIKEYDETWLISDVDKTSLDISKSEDKIYIVPNGVDAEYFKPKHQAKSLSKSLIFVGYMGAESIDAVFYFLDKAFPLILKEIPDIKFYIVGSDPPPQILALSKKGNIIVTGFVEDLRVYYEKADILIAPLRYAVGMQNKILEAMAMQVPVVTTSFGNEGIDAINGENIFVQDEPTGFAEKIIELMRHSGLRQKIGAKTREFVLNKYRWEGVLDRMACIEEIVNAK